jgi:hypothetical protein
MPVRINQTPSWLALGYTLFLSRPLSRQMTDCRKLFRGTGKWKLCGCHGIKDEYATLDL